MTVVVSFVRTKSGNGIISEGAVRVRENITVPGSTTATVQDGEIIIVGNNETGMVAVAWGTTPDAAATAETTATTAGVPVGAGAVSYPIQPKVGDKINVKAVT